MNKYISSCFRNSDAKPGAVRVSGLPNKICCNAFFNFRGKGANAFARGYSHNTNTKNYNTLWQ